MAKRGTWIALGVLTVAVTGALTFAIVNRLSTRAPAPRPSEAARGSAAGSAARPGDCVPASVRLTGIWDPLGRTRLEAAFKALTNPDAAGTWRGIADDLDGYSARWSTQWDAACHDAAQMRCLDLALAALRQITNDLHQTDAGHVASSFRGGFAHASLADCDRAEYLAAQPVLVKEADRGTLDDVTADVRRTRARFGSNTSPAWIEREGLEQDAAKLIAVGAGTSAAVAEAYALVARNLLIAPRIELALVDAAIAKANLAFATSGRPATVAVDLLVVRARLELRRAHFAGALMLVDEAMKRWQTAWGYGRHLADPADFPWELKVRALVGLGRLDEAIAAARDALVKPIAALGDHDFIALLHVRVAARLAQIEPRLALAEAQLAAELGRKVLLDADHQGPIDLQVFALAARSGDEDATARAASFALDTNTKPRNWARLGRLSLEIGAIEAAAYAGARDVHDANRALVLANVALARGDAATVRALVAPLRPATLETSYLLMIASATEDDPLGASAQLEAIRNEDAPLGPLFVGLGLAAIAAWDRALPELVTISQSTVMTERDGSYAELEAWLGRTLVETNDPRRAVPILEDSLDILDACCNGFDAYAPVAELALARALWDTDGDKPRARHLAARARNDFARLGGHREPDRLLAVKWLTEHGL